MHRRRFLELTALGSGFVAGCTADESPSTEPTAGSGPSAGSPGTDPSPPSGTRAPASYERAFEPLDLDGVDVGAYYAFIPADDWDCIDGSPAVGPYDSTADPDVVNRQIDALQGFGVGRAVFRYSRPEHRGAIDRFTDAGLADALDVELAYDLPAAITSDRDLDGELAAFSELFARPNYGTHDGRPVFTLGAVDGLLADGDRGRRIRSALPSDAPEADILLDRLRTSLTREATEPYLVADLGPVEAAGIDRMVDRNGEVFNHVDAVTNRPVLPADAGTMSWSDAFEATRQSYAALAEFASGRDIDVVPTVYPGVDRSMDRCGDDGTRIPRSPDHLGSMLETAMGLSTAPRLRIDSFNDWRRGTQIEPGSAHGRAYGRAYLDAVAAFVRAVGEPGDGDRRVHYVSPDGSDASVGSRASPLRTIQAGVDRAEPGDTVHVLPGRYFESVRTRRSGTASAPITITGPPEAVFSGARNDGYSGGFLVTHSHVHIRGLTIDGLQDPANPDDATSYMNIGIHTVPVEYEYLEGLVFKPHGIGNCRGALINLNYVEHAEVGEFRVIGPAGLDYKLGERVGHFGEVVYVGSVPGAEFNAYDVAGKGEIGEVDTTHDVHVHHIDASAGHYHIELVDVKAGCSDVTVEYCTSVDAALPNDNDNSAAVHLGGTDTRFRWNRIESAAFNAIDVGNYADYNDRIPHPDAPDAGRRNEIYGNELVGSGANAISYTSETSEAAQRTVCGNAVDTATDGQPSADCTGDVPRGDGIGHLGGDSPWA